MREANLCMTSGLYMHLLVTAHGGSKGKMRSSVGLKRTETKEKNTCCFKWCRHIREKMSGMVEQQERGE